jgi:hypothetical protein
VSDEHDGIKKSIAQIIGLGNVTSDRIASMDALERQLLSVQSWKEELRTGPQPFEPKSFDATGVDHIVEMQRKMVSRARATAEAEQRTVIALEALLQDAKDSRAVNAGMFKWARIAGWAAIAAVALTVAMPFVQTYFSKP